MKSRELSAILESLLADTLGLPSAAVQVRLLRSWAEIVGPMLGGKTFPGRVRNGVLTVFVPNHAWAQELQLSAPAFLERIRSVAGEGKIREIRFTVESWASPKDSRGPGPGPPFPADESPVPDPGALGEVRDPETREILRSICRKASRRKG